MVKMIKFSSFGVTFCSTLKGIIFERENMNINSFKSFYLVGRLLLIFTVLNFSDFGKEIEEIVTAGEYG